MVDIEKLSKSRKEWLGVWGNTWGARKVAPGTCPACVWGDGNHSIGCVTLTRGVPNDWVECQFCGVPHPPSHPVGICRECVSYWRASGVNQNAPNAWVPPTEYAEAG